MACAAPKRDAPTALQLPKKSRPASQDPVTDASRTFTIFHGSGVNSRSWVFQQSRKCVILSHEKNEGRIILILVKEALGY
jgi:hypothetical protein